MNLLDGQLHQLSTVPPSASFRRRDHSSDGRLIIFNSRRNYPRISEQDFARASLLPGHQMPAALIHAIGIEKRAILLHNEDKLPSFQDFVELLRRQI